MAGMSHRIRDRRREHDGRAGVAGAVRRVRERGGGGGAVTYTTPLIILLI